MRHEISLRGPRPPVVDTSDVVTYFLQGEHGGPIKIGRSTKWGLDARLLTLQTGHPDKLVIRRTVDGDKEERMHYRFRELHLRGEWFTPGPQLADYCGGIEEAAPQDMHAIQQAHNEGFRRGWRAAAKHIADISAFSLSELVKETLVQEAGRALFEQEGGIDRPMEQALGGAEQPKIRP